MEVDLLLLDTEDAIVGDGDAVCVGAQVGQDVLGSTKGGFAVDVPVGAIQAGEQVAEGCRACQLIDLSGEEKVTRLPSLFEEGKKLATEEGGEHANRDEEGVLCSDPSHPVERESTTGDDTMKVGMM